jgi:serine/threonine-protein kinase
MTMSPQTPPAPASVLAPPQAGAVRRWLLPGAAVLAALVAIVVMAISSSGQEGALTPLVQLRTTVAADQDIPATPSTTTSTTPAAATGAGGGDDGGNRQ